MSLKLKAQSSKLKVAVVVPAYNIEPYLGDCLDSVLAQTYRNLDIIVVDDGSTHASGAVADDYARRDSRIRVIHKPNGGLSDARNAALDTLSTSLSTSLSTTPFVTFLDGDDLLHPRFVETLLDVATATGAPIVIADWQKFTAEVPASRKTGTVGGDTVAAAQGSNGLRSSRLCLEAQAALNDIFYQRRLTNSACARLFDTGLFAHIRFPKGRLYEDIAIVYDLVMRAGSVAHVPVPLYYYRQRRAGSITNVYTPARYDIVEILDDLYDRISSENPPLLPALRSRRVSAAFNLIQLMPPTEHDRIRHCWDIITAARAACLRDPHVRLKNKAALLLSLLGKPLTTRLLRTL